MEEAAVSLRKGVYEEVVFEVNLEVMDRFWTQRD